MQPIASQFTQQLEAPKVPAGVAFI